MARNSWITPSLGNFLEHLVPTFVRQASGAGFPLPAEFEERLVRRLLALHRLQAVEQIFRGADHCVERHWLILSILHGHRDIRMCRNISIRLRNFFVGGLSDQRGDRALFPKFYPCRCPKIQEFCVVASPTRVIEISEAEKAKGDNLWSSKIGLG
jgi:hypothetical protein